jgi:hypothetical protein
MKTKISPALALFLIAPVFGELFSGSAPLNEYINPATFIILSLLYGCGAILLRELIVRWQKGWPSLLLLGFAYGIYEEGLVVRSFFDPNWMDLGALGVYGRVAGVNWVWSEHLTIYHALISMAASIAFVEILYPALRHESWITSRKWYLANWAGLLILLPVGQLIAPYDAPDGWILASWLAIFALVLLARTLPGQILPPGQNAAPAPWRFFLAGFFGVFGQFILIYNGADNGAYSFPVCMLLLALFDVFVLWLVLRWNRNGAGWEDRHRLALINGALCFFLVMGPLTTNGQYPIMYFSNPLFLLWLWWIYRRVSRRFSDEQNWGTDHPVPSSRARPRPTSGAVQE